MNVVVDFTPDQDSIGAGCAPGEQPTIGEATEAAGFDLTVQDGLLCAVDDVVAEPKGCTTFPGASWSIYLSTDGGLPQGAPADTWQIANVGLDGGPMAAGSAVLFQIQPYLENYPEGLKQPQVSLPDLLAGQVIVTTPTEPTPPSSPDPTVTQSEAAAPTAEAVTAEPTEQITSEEAAEPTTEPTPEPTPATSSEVLASPSDAEVSEVSTAPTGAEGTGATESKNSSALFWTIVGGAILVIVLAIAIIVSRRRAKNADGEFGGK